MKENQGKTKSQREKFTEAARSLGCDEDPAHFDEALKKVARHKSAKTSTGPERHASKLPRKEPKE